MIRVLLARKGGEEIEVHFWSPTLHQREVQILLCYESGPAAQTVQLGVDLEVDTINWVSNNLLFWGLYLEIKGS